MQLVAPDRVTDKVPCGNEVETHLSAINAYADAGFDAVHISRIGPDQRDFFDFYRTQILPQLPQ